MIREDGRRGCRLSLRGSWRSLVVEEPVARKTVSFLAMDIVSFGGTEKGRVPVTSKEIPSQCFAFR